MPVMIQQFIDSVSSKLFDIKFFGESFVGFFFAAFMGAVFGYFFTYIRTVKYHGWTVEIVEHAATQYLPQITKTLHLLPEEVRQILESDLEGFRYAKSLVTTYCQITTATKQHAIESGWLSIERRRFPWSLFGKGVIRVDLSVLPKYQLKDGKWNDHCEPRGWIDGHDTKKDARTIFVSGHPGAHEWAKSKGIVAEHVQHLDEHEIANISKGDTVIGTLPVHVIQRIQDRGARYVHLSLNLSAEGRDMARGATGLSPAQMEEFGAQLKHVRVVRVSDWLAN